MFRVLIVDNDASARSELTSLLKEMFFVDYIDEAASPREAIETMAVNMPDVIMSAIHLPQASGMEFARALHAIKNSPFIIFVTSSPDYAIEAFRVEATDYLLKPVDKEHLDEALQKVMRARMARKKAHRPSAYSERVRVRGVRGITYIDSDSIDYFEVKRDSVSVYAGKKTYASTMPLVKLEKVLPKAEFFRIHRNYIVNMTHIQTLERGDQGMQVVLAGDNPQEAVQLPVARRRVHDLKRGMGIK